MIYKSGYLFILQQKKKNKRNEKVKKVCSEFFSETRAIDIISHTQSTRNLYLSMDYLCKYIDVTVI